VTVVIVLQCEMSIETHSPPLPWRDPTVNSIGARVIVSVRQQGAKEATPTAKSDGKVR
jgi:hypothetical protein